MLEILKQKLKPEITDENKINKAREFLQILMLKTMFDEGNFNNLAFVGGTALRVLYGMRRYSEDLDFSLIKSEGYDFNKLLNNLVHRLKQYNFKVESTAKKGGIVHNSFIKFPSLLKDLGITETEKQKLSIKIEIDTNPPSGWHVNLSPITDIFVFAVRSFDLPSLYATKLHACFFRRYIKGRDFYDLIWYLGKKIKPNYVLLNNAIKQTEGKDLKIDNDNLKLFLKDKLTNIDFKAVSKDVERFLEDKSELRMFNKDIILSAI